MNLLPPFSLLTFLPPLQVPSSFLATIFPPFSSQSFHHPYHPSHHPSKHQSYHPSSFLLFTIIPLPLLCPSSLFTILLHLFSLLPFSFFFFTFSYSLLPSFVPTLHCHLSLLITLFPPSSSLPSSSPYYLFLSSSSLTYLPPYHPLSFLLFTTLPPSSTLSFLLSLHYPSSLHLTFPLPDHVHVPFLLFLFPTYTIHLFSFPGFFSISLQMIFLWSLRHLYLLLLFSCSTFLLTPCPCYRSECISVHIYQRSVQIISIKRSILCISPEAFRSPNLYGEEYNMYASLLSLNINKTSFL